MIHDLITAYNTHLDPYVQKAATQAAKLLVSDKNDTDSTQVNPDTDDEFAGSAHASTLPKPGEVYKDVATKIRLKKEAEEKAARAQIEAQRLAEEMKADKIKAEAERQAKEAQRQAEEEKATKARAEADRLAEEARLKEEALQRAKAGETKPGNQIKRGAVKRSKPKKGSKTKPPLRVEYQIQANGS